MQVAIKKDFDPRYAVAECLAIGALYRELLRIGHYLVHRDPLGYLWSPTALINEAYVRLVEQYGKKWVEHENVLALWSRIMRNVLIDSARSFRAAKRNGLRTDTINEADDSAESPELDLVIRVRCAMDRVRATDRRQALVLQLHFRDGLTIDETAKVLRLSPRTIKRVLRAGRVKLQDALA